MIKNELDEDELIEITDEVSDDEDNIYSRAKSVLDRMSKKHAQFEINGTGNIWILKPAGKSRGRGIYCYNDLGEIQNLISREKDYVA